MWMDKIILYFVKKRGLDLNKELKLLKAIIDALPDMLWAKNPDGSYIYANKAIINNLLFSETLEKTINKRDLEMSLSRKKEVGKENHTFGEVCGNSDYIILETEKPERFLEYGKINGEDVYLEVHKDILKDENGFIVGTVGTGRDISREYKDIQDIIDNIEYTSKDEIKEKLAMILNRYWFKG